MTNLKDKIHKLPKADVHNHLHLGGNIEMLRLNYPKHQLVLPSRFNGLEGMIDFIYNDLGGVLRSQEDVIFFMKNAIESAIKDNVTMLEASVDINLVRFFNDAIEELIATVQDLVETYKERIELKPEIGINKDSALDKVYADGIACMNSGVFFGIDLYGKELKQSLAPFKEIYEEAQLKNIKKKVHIGEFSNAETIENAIKLLKPNEIQHGIRAVESTATMQLIRENNIRMNVCPQSNIALGAVKKIEEHPIRKLYDHGINLTINTDDLLLFNATITDQIVDLIDHNIFSFEEIKGILNNGFNKNKLK